MPHPPSHPPTSPALLPAQPFFALPGQRVGLARERFFSDGQRPTGLVSEAVIQSWTRCLGARRNPTERIAFDPVTRVRLQAALARNEPLLRAAGEEITQLEVALAGTGCRAILTDGDGVVVYATPGASAARDGVLPLCARVGVNLGESAVGTNALAVVVKTGAPCTVLGGEHYFDDVQSLHCAGAPIRDGRGRLVGVLDLTVESRAFGFDAAALVGIHATAIENRLLQAGAGDHLVLQFQVSMGLLGSPLEALAGIAADGSVAWLNSTAQQLLGPQRRAAADAETLFGETLSALMARTHHDVRPLRLPNGLTVCLRARLPGGDGAVRRAVVVAAAPAPVQAPPTEAVPVPAVQHNAAPPDAATLGQHTREVIERTLADCNGNVSRAARRLGVSRGLLYRRLHAGLARGT